ncbi:MAG: hypothetical protein V4510_02195 [bacterium]
MAVQATVPSPGAQVPGRVVANAGWLGEGFLPRHEAGKRADLVQRLSLAYSSVLNTAVENWGLWHKTTKTVEDYLWRYFRRVGLEGPSFDEHSLAARFTPLLSSPVGAEAHLRLVSALLTDFGEDLADHIRYRLEHQGNVHLSFTGPTGLGKSSCAVSLMDWISEIKPGELVNHLSLDIGDLPGKLRGKRPGQSVLQDEFVQTAGEGSRTLQSLFENLEDTLRASGVNLFVASPRRQEHDSMQAELELILWNPEKKWSLFLVWIAGTPHGVVALPWMRPALYEVYKPWKHANVERSRSGHFKDRTFTARSALRAMDNPDFIEYLELVQGKPTKQDLEAALEMFHPEMLSGGQADRIVNFVFRHCKGFKSYEPSFARMFGVEPNAGMRRLAAKFNPVRTKPTPPPAA